MNSIVKGDAAARKALPLCTGVLDYFPDALLAVAELSRIGNEQHNPGQPLHWAKEKSTDEPDALLRHLIDRGKVDADGARHSAKVAWRALALLQREIEAEKDAPKLESCTLLTPCGLCLEVAAAAAAAQHSVETADPCGRPDCEEVVRGIPRDPFDVRGRIARRLDRDIAEARDRRDAEVFHKAGAGIRWRVP